jgi:sphinganine-1-phosphate aldolase
MFQIHLMLIAFLLALPPFLSSGQNGYLKRAKSLMECSLQFQAGLRTLPELRVLGSPHMSIVSWTTRAEFEQDINMFAVADVLEKQHQFKVECQQHPICLHVTLTPPHLDLVDSLVAAVRESIAYVRAHPECVREGSAATYGMVAKIPSDAVVDQFLVSYLDKVLQPHGAARS